MINIKTHRKIPNSSRKEKLTSNNNRKIVITNWLRQEKKLLQIIIRGPRDTDV